LIIQVLAFWCFNNYVEYVQKDFLAAGMVRKIGEQKFYSWTVFIAHMMLYRVILITEVLKRLLKQLDPDLYQYLASCGGEDLVFCHKYVQ